MSEFDVSSSTPSTAYVNRDGAVSGELVYSDLHCPLLVDTSSIDRGTVVEQHVGADGSAAGETVHRLPEQLVVTPAACPSCGKIVERHMLAFSPVTGVRDCPIAVNLRGNPAYTRLFGAMAGNAAEAQAEAVKHGSVGARVLRVLGPAAVEMPAAEGGSTSVGGPVLFPRPTDADGNFVS